jgi:hypothetical protein
LADREKAGGVLLQVESDASREWTRDLHTKAPGQNTLVLHAEPGTELGLDPLQQELARAGYHRIVNVHGSDEQLSLAPQHVDAGLRQAAMKAKSEQEAIQLLPSTARRLAESVQSAEEATHQILFARHDVARRLTHVDLVVDGALEKGANLRPQ